MTDMTKHGIEPVAWLYNDDAQRLLRFVPYYEPAKDGLAETPLYRADQVAEVVERLEAALQRIAIGKYDGLEVCHISARECRSIARTALEGKKA